MSECHDFSYQHYADIVRQARKTGYELGAFRDYDPQKRSIILRHDIDFSPDHALRLAALERTLGVQSTYFVLLHSEFYNAFSEATRRRLVAILELGHEIGLHYDPRFPDVRAEADLLSEYLQSPVSMIARHKPTSAGIDIDRENGLKNAYAKEFTSEIKYLSDSSQHWREGCLCGNLGKYERMQVLMHGEWWNEKTEDSFAIVQSMAELRQKEIGRHGAVEIASLRARLGV